jgi:3-hydroxyisobutyrate dehydrogenase-like beta-hydroxyacid dehydrogenase
VDRNVSVFGTGLMGSSFVRALLSAGFDVTIWNRSPEKCRGLVGDGARLAGSLEDAAAASDVLIFMVLDQDAVASILKNIDVADKCVLNYVTGSAEDAVRIESLVHEAGGRYLDAAIAAYPNDIGTNSALINYAGDRAVWGSVMEVRGALSGRSPFVSDNPGAANLLDAAWVACFHCVALGGFHEAVSYARNHGVSIEAIADSVDYFTELLRKVMAEAITAFRTGDYTTDQATLDVYLSGTRTSRDAMIQAGERATLMAANVANLESASVAGYGEQSLFAQIHTMRDPARRE